MSNKNKKKKRFSSINKHKSDGRMLRVMLADMKVAPIDWERDLMPEHKAR